MNVDTRNGVVTLTGDVDSPLAKERAVQIARNTDGVREVVDNITVTESAPTGGLFDRDEPIVGRVTSETTTGRIEPRAATTYTGDAGITSAVKAKLLADSAVSGLRIDVDTERRRRHADGKREIQGRSRPCGDARSQHGRCDPRRQQSQGGRIDG